MASNSSAPKGAKAKVASASKQAKPAPAKSAKPKPKITAEAAQAQLLRAGKQGGSAAALQRVGKVAAGPAQGWRRRYHPIGFVGDHPHGHVDTRVGDNNSLIISGTYFLGEALQPAFDVPMGAGVLEDWAGGRPLHPSYFGKRAWNIARNYGKFKFTKMRMRYVHSISLANPLASGLFIMSYAPDPATVFPTGRAGIEAVSQWAPNSQFVNVAEDSRADVELKCVLAALDSQEWLYMKTEGDQRFGMQGRIQAQAASNFEYGGQTAQFGAFLAEFEIQLSEPLVPSSLPQFVTAFTEPGNSVFQDSTGDLAMSNLSWTGSQDIVKRIDYAEMGGQLLLLAEPGYEGDDLTDLEGDVPVWIIDATYQTVAVTTAGLGSMIMVSGNAAGLPDNSLLYSGPIGGQVINQANGGNTTAAGVWNGDADAIFSMVHVRRTYYANEDIVLSIQHPATGTGGLHASITFTRCIISNVLRQSPEPMTLETADTPETLAAFSRLAKSPYEAKQKLQALVQADVDAVDAGTSNLTGTQVQALGMIASAIGLKPPHRAASAPLFVAGVVAALASAATYLIDKYGTKVAAHVLHWGRKKLVEWSERHHG